jgi:hopanoid C-3 methylase
MATSRGCSYDCNFCAIWEFYERKTRFMSATAICDRLETMEEKFVFLLDDNFLTHRGRLEELCAEIEKRGIKKYFLTQGRSDFIADNPDLMKRLRDCGLLMVLSGYESNDDDALAALRKSNTFDKNKTAAKMLRELGIISTGIFMVRPDFEPQDFDRLYDTINEMDIALPLVTILTPLPGTQLYRARRDELLTRDARLFDLLHCVLPTKIPREKFYEKLSEAGKATEKSTIRGILAVLSRRPGLALQTIGGILRFARRLKNYRPVARHADSRLRDEIGLIPPHITMANAPRRRELPLAKEA